MFEIDYNLPVELKAKLSAERQHIEDSLRIAKDHQLIYLSLHKGVEEKIRPIIVHYLEQNEHQKAVDFLSQFPGFLGKSELMTRIFDEKAAHDNNQ